MGLISPAEAKAKALAARAAKAREKKFKPLKTGTAVVKKTRKPKAPRQGVYFQSRGPHKCVKVDGKSQRGVHKALKRALYKSWDYDKAKLNNTLTQPKLPDAQITVSSTGFNAKASKYPPGNAKKQGSRLDTELTSIVKMYTTLNVPLKCFVDRDAREHHIKLNLTKPQGTKLRNLCNRMRPATGSAVIFLMHNKFKPIGTQVSVAAMGIGTDCDMLVTDETGARRVLEFKLDCSVNYGQRGLVMGAPYAGRVFTTHGHYLLQTLVNHQLYKVCIADPQGLVVGSPLLVRCDDRGAYGYALPEWVMAGASQLLPVLSRAS